ncbi:MAG: cytochrome c maturation protein CcmE [Melioribacteraceae bacterium]|nr:cytochrome c maturation protein CcmE [Melioribacteraceae bacterium]
MKNKYIIGGFIIVIFMSIMGYLLTQTSVAYENNFEMIKSSNKTIKATGAWVKEKKYNIDMEKNIFSFYMVDDRGTELKVIYKGTIPNNFESSTSVVVTGKYRDGLFLASDILTKCPSKYEETYEQSTQSRTS